MKLSRIGIFSLFVLILSTSMSAVAHAESEYLLNGSTITEMTEIDSEGEVTLIAKKVPLIGTVSVKCSWINTGYVLATDPRHQLWLLVLNLNQTQVTGLGAGGEETESCVNVANCPTPLLAPDDELYLTVVQLSGTAFLVDVTEDEEEPKGLPGYEIECMGSIALTDKCTGLREMTAENGVSDVSLSISEASMEKEAEVFTCESGEGYMEGTELMTALSGTLSLS